jgi:putative SOS response-associated peptidase YedK
MIVCVDIGYKSSLGPDGLPHLIKGIKINRELVEGDRDRPHIRAHTHPSCVVVFMDEDGYPVAGQMLWGLVADFMINNPLQMKKFSNQLFNARSERLLESGSVWSGLKDRRCLLVADGIYEHQQVEWRKQKLPYYIRFRSGTTMLLPGVFNPGTKSFAIITREGNGLFKTIHNSGPHKFRMPLFLTASMANSWIQPRLSDDEINDLISFEYPSGELRAHTVYSVRSSSPRPDGKAANDFNNWENGRGLEQGSLF